MIALTAELAVQVIEMFMRLTFQAPALMNAANEVKTLLTSGQDPTPEQMATIRAALDSAHDDLQKA